MNCPSPHSVGDRTSNKIHVSWLQGYFQYSEGILPQIQLGCLKILTKMFPESRRKSTKNKSDRMMGQYEEPYPCVTSKCNILEQTYTTFVSVNYFSPKSHKRSLNIYSTICDRVKTNPHFISKFGDFSLHSILKNQSVERLVKIPWSYFVLLMNSKSLSVSKVEEKKC